MSTFIKSLELAAPLLLLTALGYILKRGSILNDQTCKSISKLVLDVILPVNIFVAIYDSDFETAFNLKTIGFVVVSNVVVAIIMMIIAHLMSDDKRKLGAMMQAGVRGNYSIFALPLAVSIYGDKIAGPMAIAIAFLTPIYNVYAVAVFEHYQNSDGGALKQFIKIMKSPIMVATILGIVFNLCKVHIPGVIYQTLSYISKSITAVSLINLGSSFNFKIPKSLIKYIVVCLLFKLVFVPLVSLPAAIGLGLTGTELVVILVTATAPVATSAFSTAVCYDTDIGLTSSAVVYSYAGCAITIPIFLSIIFSLGLI